MAGLTFNVHIKPRKTSPDSATEIFTAAQFIPALQKIDSPKRHVTVSGSIWDLRTMDLSINDKGEFPVPEVEMIPVDEDGGAGGLQSVNAASTLLALEAIHKSKAFIRIGDKRYDLRTLNFTID